MLSKTLGPAKNDHELVFTCAGVELLTLGADAVLCAPDKGSSILRNLYLLQWPRAVHALSKRPIRCLLEKSAVEREDRADTFSRRPYGGGDAVTGGDFAGINAVRIASSIKR